jgi:hypothetical protein
MLEMDGSDQFIYGLNTFEKIIFHKIPGRDEIESGAVVVVKKETELFSSHLNPVNEMISKR